MIEINNIVEGEYNVYNAEGTWVGTLKSFIDLMDLRIQIKEASIEGYYIIFEDTFVYIDKYGYLDEWPEGFYDTHDNQLNRILGI